MNEIVIGMVGAGRAAHLHMESYCKVSRIPLRFKTIVARRKEQILEIKGKYGFESYSYNYADLCEDDEIDVIDICTPPYMHYEMIMQGLKASKHIICEKPLSGYFGDDINLNMVGKTVQKSAMYAQLMEELDVLKNALEKSNKKFMYAENFIYAPAISKAAEVIQAKKSRILYMKGEESLKGSSSKVSGYWNKTGGGTLIRVGAHPIAAVLWLKEQEAKARETSIKPESVIADIDTVTNLLSDYEHRYILARPIDVEDQASVIITFSDGSKALVIATDTCLGGSKNYLELYCNDANILCNLTMNETMKTYFLDEEGLEHIELSEMLPSKKGWNYPFISDEVLRGYVNQMQDFMECIYYDREPRSNFELGYNTLKIIYASYVSAEQSKRVFL